MRLITTPESAPKGRDVLVGPSSSTAGSTPDAVRRIRHASSNDPQFIGNVDDIGGLYRKPPE